MGLPIKLRRYKGGALLTAGLALAALCQSTLAAAAPSAVALPMNRVVGFRRPPRRGIALGRPLAFQPGQASGRNLDISHLPTVKGDWLNLRKRRRPDPLPHKRASASISLDFRIASPPKVPKRSYGYSRRRSYRYRRSYRSRLSLANPQLPWLAVSWGKYGGRFYSSRQVYCQKHRNLYSYQKRVIPVKWQRMVKRGKRVIVLHKEGYYDPERCGVVELSRREAPLQVLAKFERTPALMGARTKKGLLLVVPASSRLVVDSGLPAANISRAGFRHITVPLGKGRDSSIVVRQESRGLRSWKSRLNGIKPAVHRGGRKGGFRYMLRIDISQAVSEKQPTVFLFARRFDPKKQEVTASARPRPVARRDRRRRRLLKLKKRLRLEMNRTIKLKKQARRHISGSTAERRTRSALRSSKRRARRIQDLIRRELRQQKKRLRSSRRGLSTL